MYDRHGPAVKAYVLRRSRDRSIVDDVVAEVFVVCWRRFEELPPDPLPWLLGVARRVLSTQRRGERRRVALRERLAEGVRDPLVAVPIEDGSLRGALERLSDPDRELLLLIAWDGLSPAQAAAVLQIKPATARVRLLRARRRLTQALRAESASGTPLPLPMEGSS